MSHARPHLLIHCRREMPSLMTSRIQVSARRIFLSNPSALNSKMSFHFGTKEYAATFRNLPKPDKARLREQTLTYLKAFDPQLWYDEPVGPRLASLLNTLMTRALSRSLLFHGI